MIERAAQSCLTIVEKGLDKAMNLVNVSEKPAKSESGTGEKA
jgi:hypothetical protein